MNVWRHSVCDLPLHQTFTVSFPFQMSFWHFKHKLALRGVYMLREVRGTLETLLCLHIERFYTLFHSCSFIIMSLVQMDKHCSHCGGQIQVRSQVSRRFWRFGDLDMPRSHSQGCGWWRKQAPISNGPPTQHTCLPAAEAALTARGHVSKGADPSAPLWLK